MITATHDEIADQLRAFGQSLSEARKRARLSKAAVARAVRIDRAAVARIERGAQAPKLRTLLRLAHTLESTPAELLAVIGPPQEESEPRRHPEAGAKKADDPAKRLGANLRLARNAAGVSQQELALNAPTDWSLLSSYETGKLAPTVRSILKLAHTLGVSPAALLHGIQ